ncbi:hypothetical protein EVAR_79600_1 [Eumeta japonica]|uniref:Uncharacterized protein n=1 Tax=Eumeta variegata TaxID=151549 RepID=A0A4C1UE50_EUMVA|nr:hypothetical protein EVAR_79600_1 [Eumeta japonica]
MTSPSNGIAFELIKPFALYLEDRVKLSTLNFLTTLGVTLVSTPDARWSSTGDLRTSLQSEIKVLSLAYQEEQLLGYVNHVGAPLIGCTCPSKQMVQRLRQTQMRPGRFLRASFVPKRARGPRARAPPRRDPHSTRMFAAASHLQNYPAVNAARAMIICRDFSVLLQDGLQPSSIIALQVSGYKEASAILSAGTQQPQSAPAPPPPPVALPPYAPSYSIFTNFYD